ncbi:hypothetical protein MHYP_G00104150 [Metynnis hypsauchen]
MITEEGCSFLASALNSNHSHMRELDLSYNHPGESGKNLLSARVKDPHYKLLLRMDPKGEHFIKPGVKKYACRLTLDLNTAHNQLCLSEDNRKTGPPLCCDVPIAEHRLFYISAWALETT